MNDIEQMLRAIEVTKVEKEIFELTPLQPEDWDFILLPLWPEINEGREYLREGFIVG